MGMFDSLYDAQGREWQTKAYDYMLDRYKIGDRMPPPDEWPDADSTYQVEVLGGDYGDHEFINLFATVRDDVLVDVPAERDPSLPLVDYCGALVQP